MISYSSRSKPLCIAGLSDRIVRGTSRAILNSITTIESKGMGGWRSSDIVQTLYEAIETNEITGRRDKINLGFVTKCPSAQKWGDTPIVSFTTRNIFDLLVK